MTRPASPSASVSRRGSAGGDPERTLLWMHGEHDVATRGSVTASIARAAQVEGGSLLIDLGAVTFMDASTIGALVAGRNRLRSRGRSLEVRSPSPLVRRMLELCGLADLIQQEPVRSSRAPALASWVDIPPTALAARGTAATDVHVAEVLATAEVDRGP